MDEARGNAQSGDSTDRARAGHATRWTGATRRTEWLATFAIGAAIALLAWLPEWRTPGFYFHDDMQVQYVPAMLEIGRAARHGRLALLSEYSWFGGALAGEYQHAVFSLPHVLLCAVLAGLGLPTLALSVSLTYYALAGAGAYLAARELDFRRPLAVAIAFVAALNGFNVVWGSWLPAITGWAWLMWLWWSLERLRRLPSARWTDTAACAVATYCVLTAGWHFADLLIPPLVLGVLVRLPRPWHFRDVLLRFGLGPLLGVCLALPALLCLVEYARAGARSDFDHSSWAWTVPWRALAGLLVPSSSTRWSAFGNDVLYSNVVMAGGVLPVVVVLGTLVAPSSGGRRSLSALLIAAGLALAWSMLPSAGRVRWPFRWLPVFHLLLAVAAARAIALDDEAGEGARQRARPRRRLRRQLFVAGGGAVLVAGVLLLNAHDVRALAGGAIGLVVLAFLPFAAAYGFDRADVFCGGVVLNLIAAPLLLSDRAGTPTWSHDRCSAAWTKVDRGSRYLGVYRISDIIDPVDASIGRNACVLPGNSSMIDELTFVNGYSTLYVRGLHESLGLEVHGELQSAGVIAATGPLARPDGLLDRWGIDGLVLPGEPYPRVIDERLKRAGFYPREDLGGARIWRRVTARAHRPLLESLELAETSGASAAAANEVLANPGAHYTFDGPLEPSLERGAIRTFSEVTVAVERTTPNRVDARVLVAERAGSGPGLLLLRRPYLPGYRATLEGKPLVVGRVDGALVGVVIPRAGSGRLTIEYVPLGVRMPALIAVSVALLVLATGLGCELARRRRASDQR